MNHKKAPEKEAPKPEAAKAEGTAAPSVPANKIVAFEPLSKTAQEILKVAREKKLAEVILAQSPEETVEKAREHLPCLLLLSIANNSEITARYQVFSKLDTEMEQQGLKVYTITPLKSQKLSFLFFKRFGLTEYVVEPVPQRSLIFKVQQLLKGVETFRQQLQERAKPAGPDASDRLRTLFGSQVFVVKGAPRKDGSNWVLDLEGPGQGSGEWVPHDSASGKPAWRWVPNADQDSPQKVGDGWVAEGEKPRFDPVARKWELSAPKPTLARLENGAVAEPPVSVNEQGRLETMASGSEPPARNLNASEGREREGAELSAAEGKAPLAKDLSASEGKTPSEAGQPKTQPQDGPEEARALQDKRGAGSEKSPAFNNRTGGPKDPERAPAADASEGKLKPSQKNLVTVIRKEDAPKGAGTTHEDSGDDAPARDFTDKQETSGAYAFHDPGSAAEDSVPGKKAQAVKLRSKMKEQLEAISKRLAVPLADKMSPEEEAEIRAELGLVGRVEIKPKELSLKKRNADVKAMRSTHAKLKEQLDSLEQQIEEKSEGSFRADAVQAAAAKEVIQFKTKKEPAPERRKNATPADSPQASAASKGPEQPTLQESAPALHEEPNVESAAPKAAESSPGHREETTDTGAFTEASKQDTSADDAPDRRGALADGKERDTDRSEAPAATRSTANAKAADEAKQDSATASPSEEPDQEEESTTFSAPAAKEDSREEPTFESKASEEPVPQAPVVSLRPETAPSGDKADEKVAIQKTHVEKLEGESEHQSEAVQKFLENRKERKQTAAPPAKTASSVPPKLRLVSPPEERSVSLGVLVAVADAFTPGKSQKATVERILNAIESSFGDCHAVLTGKPDESDHKAKVCYRSHSAPEAGAPVELNEGLCLPVERANGDTKNVLGYLLLTKTGNRKGFDSMEEATMHEVAEKLWPLVLENSEEENAA